MYIPCSVLTLVPSTSLKSTCSLDLTSNLDIPPYEPHMPTTTTYAILGATGQTGSELVKHLLLHHQPESTAGNSNLHLHLNIYARSAGRLESVFNKMGLSDLGARPDVTLFIGDLEDEGLMRSCLAGASIVFSAVAQNRNEPGCSIAQRTALVIIKALDANRRARMQQLAREGEVEAGRGSAQATTEAIGPTTTVVFLASGGVDPVATARINPIARKVFHWMLYHVYTDLERSIELLREDSSESRSFDLVIAAPGGLVHSISKSNTDPPPPHAIALTGDISSISQVLSYADLARGMLRMGEEQREDGRWRGRFVGIIVNEGEPVEGYGTPLALLRYLLPNVLAMICPPLWRWGQDWWPR